MQRPAPPSQRRHRRHCGPLHAVRALHGLAAAMLLLGALRPAAEARLDPDAEPAGYSAVQPLGAYKLRTRVATHASPASSPASPTAARKAETAAATTATTTTTTTSPTTTTAKKMDDRVEPITAKPPEPPPDTAGDVADKLMQGKLPVRLGLTRGELKAVFMIVAARLRREGLAVNNNGLSDWDVVLAADASAKNTATYLLTLASEAAAPPRVPIMTLTSKVPIKLPATKTPNCICMPTGITNPATGAPGSGQHFQPVEPIQPKAEATTTSTEVETEAVPEARTKAEEAPTVREHPRGRDNASAINKGLDLIPNLSEALQQHLGTISALIAEVKQQADAKAEEAKAMATARPMPASEAPDQALKSAQRPGVSRATPWPTPGQPQAWTTPSAGPVAEPKGIQHPAGTPPRSADANDTRGHPLGVHRNLAAHAPALLATQLPPHPHHQAQHPQQQSSQAQRSPHQMHLPQSQLAQQQHHQHHPQSTASTSLAQQYPPHPELVQQPHAQHANAPPPPQFPMPPRPPEVPPPVPVLPAHLSTVPPVGAVPQFPMPPRPPEVPPPVPVLPPHLSTVPPVAALPPPQFPMPPHPLEVPPYPTPSSTALPPQAQQYPGPIPRPPVPEMPPVAPMPYPVPPQSITVLPPSEQPQQFPVPHPPVPELPPVQPIPLPPLPHSSTVLPPPSQPPKNPAESLHLGTATSDTQRRLQQPQQPQQPQPQPWHLGLPNGQPAQPAGHMVPMYNQGANPLHFAPMYPWGHYMYPVPGLAVLQPQQVQQATAHPPPLRPAMGQMQQLQQQQQQAVELAPALKALDRGGQAAAPTAVLRMGMIPGLPSMPVFPGLVNMEQKLDELGLGPSKLHVGNIGIDMSLKAPPTFELGRRPPSLQARSAPGGLEEPELPSNETTHLSANVTASPGRTTAALRTSTAAARAATRAAVRAALTATTTRAVAADAEAGGEEQDPDGEQDESASSRADGTAEDSTATDSTAGAGSATRRRPATRSQTDGSDAQDEDPEVEFTVHSYGDEEDEDVERDDEQEDDYGSWERVINGEDTSITEVPYQVALEHNGRLWCGGSIIAKAWIMTAAHCVQGRKRPTPWRVRAGSTNRETGGKLLKVRQVYTHPKYKQLKYDVALFKLAESLTYSNAIQPVKLPAKGMADPGAGEHMTISGWGRVRPTGFDYPRVLQKATVSIVARDDCTEQYSNTPFGPISEMEICAGGNRKDTCQGDSGGPMVDSSGTQVGITSWGEGCAQLPGVYANVVNQDLREFVRKIAGV